MRNQAFAKERRYTDGEIYIPRTVRGARGATRPTTRSNQGRKARKELRGRRERASLPIA